MCDDRSLLGISLSRVELSPDKSVCVIYFYTPGGLEEFEQKLERLKLYKPSIRAALSKQINGRYTPELVFKFDTVYEKSMRVEHLLDELKKKEEL